ncbi:MAG: hypothetical protein FRX49_03691 [Trebouxia sp. A1-2]|nr:MAG: hypothetical protein FRX49_03691 [Trebouxia sp. A1-2]
MRTHRKAANSSAHGGIYDNVIIDVEQVKGHQVKLALKTRPPIVSKEPYLLSNWQTKVPPDADALARTRGGSTALPYQAAPSGGALKLDRGDGLGHATLRNRKPVMSARQKSAIQEAKGRAGAALGLAALAVSRPASTNQSPMVGPGTPPPLSTLKLAFHFLLAPFPAKRSNSVGVHSRPSPSRMHTMGTVSGTDPLATAGAAGSAAAGAAASKASIPVSATSGGATATAVATASAGDPAYLLAIYFCSQVNPFTLQYWQHLMPASSFDAQIWKGGLPWLQDWHACDLSTGPAQSLFMAADHQRASSPWEEALPASGATQNGGTAGDYHITALQNASNWGQVQETSCSHAGQGGVEGTGWGAGGVGLAGSSHVKHLWYPFWKWNQLYCLQTVTDGTMLATQVAKPSWCLNGYSAAALAAVAYDSLIALGCLPGPLGAFGAAGALCFLGGRPPAPRPLGGSGRASTSSWGRATGFSGIQKPLLVRAGSMPDLLKTKDCMTGVDANIYEGIAVAGAAYLLVQAVELPAFFLDAADVGYRLHAAVVPHADLRDPLEACGMAPQPRLGCGFQGTPLDRAQAALGHTAWLDSEGGLPLLGGSSSTVLFILGAAELTLCFRLLAAVGAHADDALEAQQEDATVAVAHHNDLHSKHARPVAAGNTTIQDQGCQLNAGSKHEATY